MNELKEKVENLENTVKDLSDIVISLRREIRIMRGDSRELYPRKECKTVGCTREAPQHGPDYCGNCRREKRNYKSINK